MSLLNRLKKLEEKFRVNVKACFHPPRFRSFRRTADGEEVVEGESPEIVCDVCGQKCPITHNIESVVQRLNPETRELETIPLEKAS